jgi:hypothetical protein
MRSTVIGAIAVCAAALAALGQPRSAPADSASLLAKYAPVLELYAVDRKPSAVGPFLAGAYLERLSRNSYSGGGWEVVRRSPPPSALANRSEQLRLDTRGCSPAVNVDACYSRRPTPPTIYGRLWAAPGTFGYATILQYWLFYALDDWRNSTTKPTLWHMHEGDWEEVSVALGPSGAPVAVAASQHDLGVRRVWNAVQVRNGTHPVVWVALGSHANYLLPGFHGRVGVPHVISPRFSGIPLPEPDFTSSQVAVSSAAVVDLSASPPPWLSFAGAWGDGSYVLLQGQGGGAKAVAHLRIGNSPPGPAFHSIWRDPLVQFRSWPADDGH